MDQRIVEVFASIMKCSPGEVHDGRSPENMERWDSLQHLVLVVGVEEEFGIELEPEEIVEMYQGFSSFRRVVEKKLDGGSANGTMRASP